MMVGKVTMHNNGGKSASSQCPTIFFAERGSSVPEGGGLLTLLRAFCTRFLWERF